MNIFEIIVIANLEVNDANEYRKYEKGFFPILKKYNGSFITFDDDPEHKESQELNTTSTTTTSGVTP